MTDLHHHHYLSTNLHRWCIYPPVMIQRKMVPPKGTADWRRIAFQPMLYLCLWVAAIVIIVKGDFATIPPIFADEHSGVAFWLWSGLSLICPPLAMVSLWFIQSPHGERKYQGLWLRLAADVGQLTAVVVYLILRFAIGDWHVYPMGALIACVIFVAHLVLRDAERIYVVEKLASKIHQKEFLRDAGA